ncbi:glycine cleavage system protein H [Salinicoccus albus]|uniref:glycine cleavage system protein H n=1 Tax=Salinicoccus albus TaxID=418756 RepID=UPI00036DD3C8|nr:glycine cleavage system protein H [Salinicoccus albus]
MKKRGEFLFIEKNGDDYTLSMTPELQDDIGTSGFVEYTDADTIEAGDLILSVEASKTVLELDSPLAGKIVKRNEALINEPALLNSAKAEENWIITLTDVDEEAFNQLEEVKRYIS